MILSFCGATILGASRRPLNELVIGNHLLRTKSTKPTDDVCIITRMVGFTT